MSDDAPDQRFDDLLMIGLQDMGCQVTVLHTAQVGDSGIFRVTTSDGRAYSIHFDRA